MKTKIETTDKATARPWHSSGYHREGGGYTVDLNTQDGITVATLNAASQDLCESNAALIVRAVNEHAALLRIMSAARNLSLEVSTCGRCDGSGKQHHDTNDACHLCGGSGKVSSIPYSGEVETLLAALAAVRDGKAVES